MALRQRPAPTPPTVGRKAPIQVVPPGLLGLLQLKSLGGTPGELADAVQGVLELRDWYFTARRLGTLALLNVATPPTKALGGGVQGNFTFTVPVVVPQNQIWYVEQLTLDAVNTGAMVATDLLRYCGVLLAGSGNIEFYQVTPDVSDYQLAARTRVIDCKSDRGFWAFPGDNLGFRVFDNVTTNGWTFALQLRGTPMQL